MLTNFRNLKKLPTLKRILALWTWGQKSLVSELWPFEKGNFDLGHPVFITWRTGSIWISSAENPGRKRGISLRFLSLVNDFWRFLLSSWQKFGCSWWGWDLIILSSSTESTFSISWRRLSVTEIRLENMIDEKCHFLGGTQGLVLILTHFWLNFFSNIFLT